jgi:tRNA1(Val) A37 N6-methylase TrmN6
MSVPGSVTRARRPDGWRAPGPPPETPPDRDDVWPGRDEILCHLVGDWRILQRRDGHRWSLDDLVTAWVAGRVADANRPPRRAADLGCGIGAVLLMLAWKLPDTRCIGFEAQSASIALARRSIAWNGVVSRCEARLADLRDLDAASEPFELVTGTPPYLPLGTATTPRRAQQAGCHLELRGGIEDYCRAARAVLAPAGRFVVCHSDLARTQRAASDAGFSIDERLDVVPREGKPRLFSVFSMIAGETAVSASLQELIVRDIAGQWTEEFRALRAEMGMPTPRTDAALPSS